MPDQLPEDLIAKADVYSDLIKKLHKVLMEVKRNWLLMIEFFIEF